MVSSDGASRGNPGIASAAACVCLMAENGVLHVVAWKAIALGIRSSVVAEFEAAVLGQSLLVAFVNACVRDVT